MAVTIKDIASEAGVSPTTVSLVLNDKPCRVSQSTRDTIFKVASANHYMPNQSARTLVKRASGTLGLIIPDISNPYFSELAKGVEREAQKENYSVIFCNSDDNGQKDIKNFKTLAGRQVDGLIIVSSIHEANIKQANQFNHLAAEHNIPVVQLDRKVPGGNYDFVGIDNVSGGYIATKYLIDQGYTQIGCIYGPDDVFSAKKRFEGYLSALGEYGIARNDALIKSGDYSVETGEKYATWLIENGAKAIFACNDLIACGIIKRLYAARLKPGIDYALVGFDNSPVCEYLDMPLTTINQPFYDMGKSACNIVICAIRAKVNTPVKQTINFSPNLVIRQTTPKRT